MTKTSFTRCLAVLLAVSGILWGARFSTRNAAMAKTSQAAPAPDPRLDMIKTLQAMGPHPSLGDQANVFGRFVGTWDVDYGVFSEDGRLTHAPGEMIVGWILDGHALQDLFIGDPESPGEERMMGTTVRYIDQSGKWHVIYVEPHSNSVVKLTGGQEGDRIVLYSEGRQSPMRRWSFNEIKDNSFTWRGEMSSDGGKTWRLAGEHHMTRRTPSATDPRLDMVKTLQALGPHPSMGDQANVFGRFVGTWDAKYTTFVGGKARNSSGQVIVGWILDGHALQDLFITDPKRPGDERHMGTSVRYFDNKSGKWHITYIQPPFETIYELTGGQEGDRIVLHLKTPPGAAEELWSFNDIRPDSFVWRNESSKDGGKTWMLDEEYHMTRHTTPTAKR